MEEVVKNALEEQGYQKAQKEMDNPLVKTSPDTLLALAVEKDLDTDKLKELMAMKMQWDAAEAKKSYGVARIRFQSECPTLKKAKLVNYTTKKGTVKYNYIPLSDIADLIREPLAACGLSYRWEIDEKELIKVCCVISHAGGHSESTSMSADLDDTGAKNKIQQRGSTITYLQRYTLIGALGLTSADTDDDGKSSGQLNVERLLEHVLCVRDCYDTVAAIKEGLHTENLELAAQSWAELSTQERMNLDMAPTKGGIFTIEEKHLMSSYDFKEHFKLYHTGDQL